MCGIAGFNWGDQEKIQKMNRLLKHRGPDGDGVFVAPEISLGHTRLAILDLSERGKQPMTSTDGMVIVSFNGEIYNFRELRRELEHKGYRFRSATDTEVILHAYDAWGIDAVKKFNGIFSIALWDSRKKQLYLIRDHVGVKPLYYYWRDGKLIFASEIKSILAHGIPRVMNREAVNVYFRMLYVPAPQTMFQHIQKVEPGTYLLYKEKNISTHRYWNPELQTRLSSRDEAVDRVGTLLKDSVRRQLISERPVGVFLSGGVDSTAILGIAHECLSGKVETFTAGFDIAPEKFNADFDLARKTSYYYATSHHELIVTGADAAAVFPDIVFAMDEPVANATQIATYLLSKFARKNIVVALGGDGGDELFGGYERYRLSRIISLYQRVPRIFRKPASMILREKKLEMPPGVKRYLAFMAQKEHDVTRVLLPRVDNEWVTPHVYGNQYFSSGTTHDSDSENALMWADIRSWLPDESLVRSDKLSMAVALEQRVPLLDYRLVELSLQIPSAWKISSRETKSLLKQAVAPHLPSHLARQPKRGWFSPGSAWLRRELKPLMDDALCGESDILNLPEIQRMYADHCDVKAYHLNLLWAVLTFQMWRKKFMI